MQSNEERQREIDDERAEERREEDRLREEDELNTLIVTTIAVI